MGNCGGHNEGVDLKDFRIIPLPRRSAAKHQPLDLSMIDNCNIWYRALPLRSIIKILEERSRNRVYF